MRSVDGDSDHLEQSHLAPRFNRVDLRMKREELLAGVFVLYPRRQAVEVS
jgi:hypothetical protein